MEVSDEVADGRHTVTTKLTATLCGRYTPMAGPVAVLLTCADGTRLLRHGRKAQVRRHTGRHAARQRRPNARRKR